MPRGGGLRGGEQSGVLPLAALQPLVERVGRGGGPQGVALCVPCPNIIEALLDTGCGKHHWLTH